MNVQPAVADVNRVIAIFRKYNFASFSPSPKLRTAAAWQSFMREFSFGHEFQHLDIGPQLQLDYPDCFHLCKPVGFSYCHDQRQHCTLYIVSQN